LELQPAQRVEVVVIVVAMQTLLAGSETS